MTQGAYTVLLTGRVVDGHDPDSVVVSAASLFKITLEKAELLLNQRTTVRRNLEAYAAHRYVAAIRNAGLEAISEFDPTATAQAIPGKASAGDASAVSPATAAQPGNTASPAPIYYETTRLSLKPDEAYIAPRRSALDDGASPSIAFSARRPGDLPARIPIIDCPDIAAVLNTLGLPHLLPLALMHGIDKEGLPDLSDDDLQVLGFKSIEDRRTLLMAAQELREQRGRWQAKAGRSGVFRLLGGK